MRLRFMRPLLLGAATFFAMALAPTLAEAGCCMERQSDDGDSPWIEIGDDFDRCEDLNDAEDDGDDIFEPIGFIWWNVKC